MQCKVMRMQEPLWATQTQGVAVEVKSECTELRSQGTAGPSVSGPSPGMASTSNYGRNWVEKSKSPEPKASLKRRKAYVRVSRGTGWSIQITMTDSSYQSVPFPN